MRFKTSAGAVVGLANGTNLTFQKGSININIKITLNTCFACLHVHHNFQSLKQQSIERQINVISFFIYSAQKKQQILSISRLLLGQGV